MNTWRGICNVRRGVPQGPFVFILGAFLIFGFLFTLVQTKAHPHPYEQQKNSSLENGMESLSSMSDSRNSYHFWRKSNRSSIRRSQGPLTASRHKRQDDVDDWNDFGNSYDDDIFGDDDLHLTTSKTTTSESTTVAPTTQDDELRRTVRETDDEDLIGSGEEGSGSRETPSPDHPSSTTQPDNNGFNKRFYRVTMLINKPWSPALATTSSNPFKVNEDELSQAIMRSSGYEIPTVKVIQFTDIRDPAYIEVRFDIGVEDVPKGEIEKEFDRFLNVGAIGDIRVKRDGFNIQDLGSPLEHSCLENEVECRNGRCVPVSFRCDEKDDCGDLTDEENCPSPVTPSSTTTTSTTTTTTTTTLKPPVEVTPSPNPSPTPSTPELANCRADDQVRCHDGKAIICADQVCDGNQNCPGGEDEDLRMNCSMADSCEAGFFQCDLGKCLPESLKCNSYQDCQDGTDENVNECQSRPPPPMGSQCGRDEFRCQRSQRCLPVTSICNGFFDCGPNDKSDEDLGCPCSSGQFKCGTGICILQQNVCDGLFQCSDRSDELNCLPRRCSAQEFSCQSDGACVPLSAKCNQRSDCRDGSDEANCGCRSNEYRCEQGGQCLSISKRCDRRNDCPGGDDEQGCGFEPDPVRCNNLQFQCRDSSCIDSILKCDGFSDCPDSSDEDAINCPGQDTKCPPYQFQCFDRSCVSIGLKCDGYPDCRDRSDESPELCKGSRVCANWEFRCDDGSCIEKELVCNGRFECYSGSDERNCTTCKAGEFRCESGGCIKWTQRCDYIPDCRDNSDEDPAICYGVCGEEDVLCGDGNCVKRNQTCDGVCDCVSCDDELELYCPEPGGGGVTLRPTSPPAQCAFGEFRCRDGACISDLLRCQGKVDCPDSSDEENCPSCLDSFRCSNGQCIDSRYKCDGTPQCPNGEDEQNCGSSCTRDQFPCANGQCIPLLYKCDNVPDCADNSDEMSETCPDVTTCQPNEFKCIAGGCIAREKLCDKRFDCADGSDEVSATCPPPCQEDEFRCTSDGSCIPQSSNCNQRSDCPDGSDEQNCPPQPSRCGFGQFACRSGNQCIPGSAVCNSIYDCNDYSDESNCGGPPEGLHLKTYPSDQSIKQGNEVVFQCRDEGQLRASVRWVRGNGIPLPPGSRDFNGRLEMPNIGLEHSGTYICEAVGYPESTPGAKVAVYLRVDPSAGKPLLSHYDFGLTNDTEWQFPLPFYVMVDPKTYPTTDGDEPPPTRPPTACALHEATCNNGECISKNMICDGDKDCEDGSDEMRCRSDGCEPNEFQCANKKCVLKTWRCDGEDDCQDMSDEQNCTPPPPGSPCRYNEFQCSTGQTCIMKSFQCDKELDCPDRSDEYACSPPSIQTPPPSLITLDVGNVFNISCKVNGVPTPEVVWRLNWGHVPDKCTSRCEKGLGVLTCEDIQIEEQGAYSCEAINSLGSTFAIPDCTLVVRSPMTSCGPGKFNEIARTDEECIPCFCFGQTNQCSSIKLYMSQLPPPEANYHLIGVSQDLLSGNARSPARKTLLSALSQPINQNFRTDLAGDVIPFFALPTSYTGNQLRTYGGYLRYKLRYRGTAAQVNGADVVISGNGIALLHVGRQSWTTGRDHEVAVQFWPGEWFKRVVASSAGGVEGVEPASREEILKILANIEYLLIRAQYDEGSSLDTTVSSIRMDTASTYNTGLGQAVFVEECRCPPGYLGLSCEECAPGYERIDQGPWLGRCQPIRERCPEGTYDDLGQCRPCPCPGAGRKFGKSCYRDTDNQITCACNVGHTGRNCADCSPNYAPNPNYPYDCRPVGVRCDVDGSLSPTPDPFTQRCNCKENAIGPLCDQCKAGTFHLSTENQYGCINCFCMGIVTQCASSDFYRTQERTSFYNSPQGFALVDSSQQHTPLRNLTVEPSSREVSYKAFSGGSGIIYYWQLPEQYIGDKITSYGGFLNYTVRYVPPPGGQTSPNTGPDVELNGNDIRLLYFRRGGTISPNRPETVAVPLLEQYWQRQDGRTVNREHFLMTLANLDGLLIKATYTTYSREAYLSDVSLDYAIPSNTGQDRAWPVEQCTCPEGYLGLSCQECSSGFTRSLKGLYLGLCEECNCNGHSDECDPKSGVCKNCRGFTAGDFCDECEDGYTGNPKTGDCVPNSSSACRCDPRGSIRPDCPDGRNCICKGNAEGPSCGSCRRGTFSLQETNPQGCLQCYCSGLTAECSAGNLYRLRIEMQIQSDPHGFTLTDSYRTTTIREITVDTRAGELVYSFLSNSPRRERLFWSLPSKFTGRRISSYGGKLRATRRYYVRPGTVSNPTEDIDVILIGKNGISLFYSGSILAGQTVELEVTLRETAGWRHSDGTAKLAGREDLLGVLADVEAILIRATFTEDMESTHLKDVSIDDAVRQYTQYGTVSDVEECRCPLGWTGLSCESCSAMFYRDLSDRSRGLEGACKKCPCGENAEGCTYESGRPVCTCRPGFSGRDCEIRDRVVVELSPVKVNSYADGRLEEFRCSYQSRLKLRIEFRTFPDWRMSSSLRASSFPSPSSSLPFGVLFPDPTWTDVLTARIPINPQLRLVACRITNEDGEVVAEVFASIHSAGTRPTPQPIIPTTGPSPDPQPENSELEVRISEPRDQDVESGGSVMFRCSARSQSGSQLRIAWVKEVGSIPVGRARDDGQGLLVFSDVRPEDVGIYVCQATDGYSTTSERARLSVNSDANNGHIPPVESRPDVTITPRYLTLDVGSPAEFRCTATGNPTPTITWSGGRNGQLPSHARSQNGVLSFSAVRKSDEAEYHCRAENSQGVASLRTILYIQGEDDEGENEVDATGRPVEPEPSTEPEPPFVVSVNPPQSEAQPGETVRMRCSATDRSAQMQWTKDGGPLPQSSTQSADGQLTIYSVTEEDSGVYVCTGTNFPGQTGQGQGRLDVSYEGVPPVARIEPERQTVTQGSEIEIRCVASGNPQPTIQWTKASGALPPSVDTTSGVLRIPNAEVSQRGVYICNVENSVGRSLSSAVVEVERREPPQLEIFPSSRQTVLKDSSILFQCRLVAGIPSPTITWSRSDGLPMPRNVEEIPGGVLRFNKVTGEEKGPYMCTAENFAGTTSATAYLEVQIPPQVSITPPSPHRVRTGERVRLECRAEGDPIPSVSWSKLRPGQQDGVSLPMADDVFRTPQNAIYEISRAAKDDEGFYSCAARNDAGVEEGRLQLIVDENGEVGPGHGSSPRPEPSQPTIDSDEVYHFPLGSRAELRCAQNIRGGIFEQLYLDWERADGGLLPSHYEQIDGNLYINSVRAEDAGRYSCVGTNGKGQVVFTSDAILEVSGSSPPHIELRPARQIVRRGDSVYIHCSATGQEPININWSRVDRNPFHADVFVNGPDLTFRSIETTDAGRYACTATNSGGTSESVAEVIVNGQSSNGNGRNGNGRIPTTSRPVQRVRTQVGIAGQRIDLNCNIRGSGVIWSKDNGPLPLTAIALGPILTLMSLSPNEAGRYTCESSEGYDEIELAVEAHHDYELNGVDDEEDDMEGKWTCESGDQVIPISQLCDTEIDCLDASDEKTENCGNGYRSFRSIRHLDRQQRNAREMEPVTVRVTANKDLVRVGEDVDVRCDIIGDSNPFIRWHKVGGGLGSNVNVNGNFIRVSSAMPDNAGIYRCVATTRSGIYEDDYTLTIQANPDVPMNSQGVETQNVPFGSTVKMNCSTHLDDPIAYTWSKENGIVPDDSTMEGPVLIVPDLVPEDSGIYVCTATNPSTSVDISTILTVTGVVPYFTQAPASFMTLPTLPDSYHTLDIETSFKPEDKNGLLLYNAQRKDGTGDFFSFGLTGGVPNFRFDVGSGPVVITADRAVEMGKWSTVKLSRDKVSGSMTVNGQGPFVGHVRGSFEGLDLIEKMYVGGMPNFGHINRQAGFNKGFVGCVSELIISGKKQLLLRDLQTSRGISTCDTCAGISCLNDGICQEGLTSRGYKCICNPGHAGSDCENSVEACYPGVCGATGKCVNGLGGYECFCPFGKAGIRCERDVLISQPSFKGNSFLSYPTPRAIKKLKIGMRLKRETSEDGLLIYSSQSTHGDGDFAALSLKDDHLEFQYNTGSGPALIRSRRSVTVGEWVNISVERDAQNGELSVGGEEAVKGKSPGPSRGLNLNTQLYLGGYDHTRVQLNPSVRVKRGFQGCVSKLEIEGMKLNLVDSILESGNVEHCDVIPLCSSRPCRNGGICSSNSTYTYNCDCPVSYSGVNCELRDSCSSQPCANGGTCHNLGESSFKCSCAKGFHGRFCNTALNFTESVAFRGEGFIELGRHLFLHSDPDEEEIIQLEISTISKYGLILWQGQLRSHPHAAVDFMSIGLNDGKIEFSWDLGMGEGSVISELEVNDGNKHIVVIRREGVEGSIEIDGGEIDVGVSEGAGETLDTPGHIFLGGAPNPRGMTNGRFSDGFTGCIHSLSFQEHSRLNLHDEAITAVNTGPCTNTPPYYEEGSGHYDGSKWVSTRKEESVHRAGNKTIKTIKVITNTTEYFYSDEEPSEENPDFEDNPDH